jgi:signal transduction histidine kinase
MTLAWVGWALGGRDYRPPQLTALVMLGLAGGVLAGLTPASGAVAMGAMVTFSAATFLRTDIAAAILAATVAAFLVAGLVTGGPAGFLVGYCFAYAGMWTMGMTRHAFVARAELAEQTLDEARRLHEAQTQAHEAQMQAAALSERARIAREIHGRRPDAAGSGGPARRKAKFKRFKSHLS